MSRDRWEVEEEEPGLGVGVMAGQAGATWLEETDEVWVLETAAAAASSSPNGFFPQHTVVIMQFLN